MKKLIALLVLVGVMLGAVVAPATVAAQSSPYLSALASYFPADIPLYVGVRTDTAFIDELNTLLHSVAAQIPQAGMVPDLHQSLNDAVKQALGEGADFDSVIRPWLGDSAALGVLSLDSAIQGNTNDIPVLFAASITDRTAAETFIEKLIADKSLPLVKTTEHGATVFSFGMATPEPDATATAEASSSAMSDMGQNFPAVAVTDDAVLIAKSKADLPLNGDFLSLAKSDKFGVVGNLPADSYNAIVYANLGKTFQAVFGMLVSQMRSSGTDTAMLDSLMPIYANYPTQALGFTILDGKALTLDLAQGPFDYSLLAGTPLGGIDMKAVLKAPAVDPSFAKVIPADAPLSIQGTNLGNTVSYLIDAMGLGLQYGIKAAQMYRSSSDTSYMPRFLKDIGPEDLHAFIDLSFAGFTGLNLQDDVLAHINGNSALYGRFLPVGSDSMTLDTALVTEADSASAVQNIFDKLKIALDRYKAKYTTEGDSFVLPDVIRGFFPDTFSDDKLADPAYDFMVGHNGQLIAVGSRPAVEFSLGGSGASLADDPSYQAAQKYFLDGTQSIWYLNGSALGKLVAQAAPMMSQSAGMSAYSLQQLASVFGLIDSGSITWTMNDKGSVVRMVLSLNTAPAAEATPAATMEMMPEATVESVTVEAPDATMEAAREVEPAAAIEATAEATP